MGTESERESAARSKLRWWEQLIWVVFAVLIALITGGLWYYFNEKPVSPTVKQVAPTRTPNPLTPDTLKRIAALTNSPKADWVKTMGEPDLDSPPAGGMPRDAGQTDWDYDNVEVSVSWLQTKKGVLPWAIGIRPINGQPDQGTLELDLIAGLFGLTRSKTNDREGDYEWKSADGAISAQYSRSDQAEPGLGGLHVYVEKPAGEATPTVEECSSGNTGRRTPIPATSPDQR